MLNIPNNCPHCGNKLNNSDHSVASSSKTTVIKCPKMVENHWIITTRDLVPELMDLLLRGLK